MEWLRIPAAFALVLVSAFASLLLRSAWERRVRREEALEGLLALLPGHDCGLCGEADCRSYARARLSGKGPAAPCSPGGDRLEASLASRRGAGKREAGEERKVAFIRCGGVEAKAERLFVYAGAGNCATASAFYGGGKACSSACLGFLDCARACPLDAIGSAEGLAFVRAERCSGCGLCLAACPKGLITLVNEGAAWQVACAATGDAESRLAGCRAACTGCGECVRLSTQWEFALAGGLAAASPRPTEGVTPWGNHEYIAGRCPTGAILDTGIRNARAPRASGESTRAAAKKR